MRINSLMRVNYGFILATLVMLLSCSQKTQNVELSNPGFGVTRTDIEVLDEGVDLPVLLRTDDIIKGIQFTLSWDSSVAQVIKPALTSSNPAFTISSNNGSQGEMKVLIFSMSGGVLNTTDSNIMTIPVRIIDPDARLFNLVFKDVIFAGPGAVSYEIPVSQANLKVIHE